MCRSRVVRSAQEALASASSRRGTSLDVLPALYASPPRLRHPTYLRLSEHGNPTTAPTSRPCHSSPDHPDLAQTWTWPRATRSRRRSHASSPRRRGEIEPAEEPRSAPFDGARIRAYSLGRGAAPDTPNARGTGQPEGRRRSGTPALWLQACLLLTSRPGVNSSWSPS